MPLPIPLRRLAYRTAYRGLCVYWFVARPRMSGVKCVLTEGERVLLVRHTYGPRTWDLPGGAIKRNERPVDAAGREMAEELGVQINNWRELGEMSASLSFRRDTIHCFHAELIKPRITIDRGELNEARWFPREELPDEVGRYTLPILARAEPAAAAGEAQRADG